MNTIFKVSYLLKKTVKNTGEYISDQLTEEHSLTTTTNDLNEIFTDLFELHRYDGLIALEILSVEKDTEAVTLQEIYEIICA